MKFNTEKCKVMHIGRHNPMFAYRYTMENKQLEAARQERDLGGHHCRRFEAISALYWKLQSESLGLVKRTVWSRQPGIIVNLCKSIVRPHLEYCSPASSAWSPYYKKDEGLLEKIQHRFTRLFKHLKDLTWIVVIRRKTKQGRSYWSIQNCQ